MRKTFTYLLLAFAASAVALSCHREIPVIPEEDGIFFIAEEGTTPASKALLNNNTLKTNGNRVHVMDVLAGFSGTASWAEGNLVEGGLYINDDVVYSGAVVWGFNSGRVYPWTTDGGHQFFGWLSYDSALDLTADTRFGTTLADDFDYSNRKLPIPALEMTADSDQFDFMYGNTAYYLMPRTSTDPVPITLQHLFSAISLQIKNESMDEILVKNVTIEGLKNKKSAEIPFVGDPTFTNYTATHEFLDNALYYALPTATKTLTTDQTYDLLARVKNTAIAEYRLIWPQTEEELAPSDVNDISTYPITVEYEYLADEEHINHTAKLRFPEGESFEPGVRYAFTLLFTQKHIQLTFKVNPWNYNLYEWSYDEQSISEVKELDFKDNPGYDKPSKTCRIVGGDPVKGTFSVVNPSGAIWSIEPVGDVEYFTISPNQGTVDSNNPDYEFYVIPNLDPSLDRSTDKELRFKFHIQFTNGTVHDANSEINRDDWTVILPKN
ncbi:MAG: fimbrillin family protein [Bacteroidales bacterium]|nr:fimbrillin family protein [Bacteroidales bacterium]